MLQIFSEDCSWYFYWYLLVSNKKGKYLLRASPQQVRRPELGPEAERGWRGAHNGILATVTPVSHALWTLNNGPAHGLPLWASESLCLPHKEILTGPAHRS